MAIKYTEIYDNDKLNCIKAELGDGLEMLIPTDPANSDYQAYLESLKDAAN